MAQVAYFIRRNRELGSTYGEPLHISAIEVLFTHFASMLARTDLKPRLIDEESDHTKITLFLSEEAKAFSIGGSYARPLAVVYTGTAKEIMPLIELKNHALDLTRDPPKNGLNMSELKAKLLLRARSFSLFLDERGILNDKGRKTLDVLDGCPVHMVADILGGLLEAPTLGALHISMGYTPPG